MHLLEFKAACYDLEVELEPSEGKKQNTTRKFKMKMDAGLVTYQDPLKAQVFGLEKTYGTEEKNWKWVVSTLKKPYNNIIEKAEDILTTPEIPVDHEAEKKIQLMEEKKQSKISLPNFEGKLRAEIDAAKSVYEETTIWLSINHTALLDQVNSLMVDLNEKHLVICSDDIRLKELRKKT